MKNKGYYPEYDKRLRILHPQDLIDLQSACGRDERIRGHEILDRGRIRYSLLNLIRMYNNPKGKEAFQEVWSIGANGTATHIREARRLKEATNESIDID